MVTQSLNTLLVGKKTNQLFRARTKFEKEICPSDVLFHHFSQVQESTQFKIETERQNLPPVDWTVLFSLQSYYFRLLRLCAPQNVHVVVAYQMQALY